MLARNTYDQDYIDQSRTRVAALVSAYEDLARAAAGANGTVGSALDSFEPEFFNNMVLVLDNLFVHRTRKIEGKDGNPANEVRVLCNSLTTNGGVVVADTTITLKPDTSVLGYDLGDEIKLGEDDFRRLADAYFAEIERRFAV